MTVYVTSTGAFLPGQAVSNEEMEDVLGTVYGKPSRLKKRILKANGIKQRYYAIDQSHHTYITNEEMAVAAGRQCLERSSLESHHIQVLSCATSQGDRVLPGFGSQVQAGMDVSNVELYTSHGICSSSVMALKTAANVIRVGDQHNALVIASELVSRLFKNTRFEALSNDQVEKANEFETEFLRWMLSDGAGAVLLESKPKGRSLRIDWIRSFSNADVYPVCMSVGSPSNKNDTRTWQDFPSYAEAEKAGALLIRQDIRLLENIVKVGVDGALRLIREGVLDVPSLDHFLCHYSSHHFRGKIVDLLAMAGVTVPDEKWYTNLYTRGNTGCASIFIMLDEFLRSKTLTAGERILCMVPESGRFNCGYIHMTVVEA